MSKLMRSAQELPLLSDSDISLDLSNQKTKAKRLRDAVRSGDDQAWHRVETHHPRPQVVDVKTFKLSDAQCVIAREAGLSSWPALKAHMANMDATRIAIEENGPAPDADLRTLHIRCGNDIELGLHRAGFTGDFLMYPDPICQGPVSDLPLALEDRARFISTEYPREDFNDTLSKLKKGEERLARARDYERITLWFEHDPYDQFLLVKVLTRLKAWGADTRKVELMSLHCFPGITKFLGIGQLSPTALRHMYSKREAVSAGAYQMAEQAWSALSSKTPEALFELGRQKSPFLPYLAGAVQRYLAELPGLDDGLSFTERTALKILDNGPMAWGKVFGKFLNDFDPLPYHGDLMYLGALLRLRDAGRPAVASQPLDLSSERWGKTEFSLTDTGRALLAGDLDWKECAPRQRVHGGVRCFGSPDWRWNNSKQVLLKI